MRSTTTIESDLRSVGNDVENLLNNVGRESSSTVSRAYETALDRLAEVDERLRNSARDAAHTAEDFVHTARGVRSASAPWSASSPAC
jgi:ElaB/YqjD/DUF883 family membrane-anchored ribosome-binding protein